MLTTAAMQVMQDFTFPGNVRQLENICHWITGWRRVTAVDIAGPAARVRGATVGSPVTRSSRDACSHGAAGPVCRNALAAADTNAAAAAAATNGSGHTAASPVVGGDWQQALAAALAAAIQHGSGRPANDSPAIRGHHDPFGADTNQRTPHRPANGSAGECNTLTRKTHELGMDGEV